MCTMPNNLSWPGYRDYDTDLNVSYNSGSSFLSLPSIGTYGSCAKV